MPPKCRICGLHHLSKVTCAEFRQIESKTPVSKYFLMTIQRPGYYPETIVDNTASPVNFLLIERELGRKTIILFCKEISKKEYEMFQGR